MKASVKIILFLLLPAVAPAQKDTFNIQNQQYELDSLHIALKSAVNDTLRMDLYKKLSFFYMQAKRDSSLYYGQQQLLISQKLRLKLWEADALGNIGFLYRYFGNYPRSLQFLLNALEIAENPESEKNFWHISKAETSAKARSNVLASIHLYLGVLYGDNNNLEQQLLHCKQSQKFAAEINNMYRLSLVNMTLGTIYINLHKLDSALAYSLNALDYNNQSADKKNRGIILGNIGTIYLKKENYSLAKQYFLEAIQESQKLNNLQSLAGSHVSLSNLFAQTGDSDSSLWYAKKGLEIFQTMGGSPNGLVSAYTCLFSIYKLRNNVDSAFKYQGLAMEAKDSLNNAEKIKQFHNIGFDEQLRLQELEKEIVKTQNRIRTYSLLAGIAVFMLIAFLLLRNNRNRKKANKILQGQKEEIEVQKINVETTLTHLKSTQAQLIQSEKMASLGELTAGIAHEIQNPLNFVNNFSEVSNELIDEMKTEFRKGDMEEGFVIADDIKQNLEKILHHGKRADVIVKGMLQHSSSGSGKKEPTNINALADEYLRLAYHGLRAKDKTFNATMKTDFDETIGNITIIPQDIGRVLLNIINNSFQACSSDPIAIGFIRCKTLGIDYHPEIIIKTKRLHPSDTEPQSKVMISIHDNGTGIPDKIIDKIFQPFFTTKPTGQGTGLGLSLAYDIIKAHGGTIEVKSNYSQPGGEIKAEPNEESGTTFIITLPI